MLHHLTTEVLHFFCKVFQIIDTLTHLRQQKEECLDPGLIQTWRKRILKTALKGSISLMMNLVSTVASTPSDRIWKSP
jgi:hypothetical protein